MTTPRLRAVPAPPDPAPPGTAVPGPTPHTANTQFNPPADAFTTAAVNPPAIALTNVPASTTAAAWDAAPPGRQLRLTPATSIVLRPTHWLWTDRIPAGALVLGPGREGIGKSLFCAWLTARVTTGTLPGLHDGNPRSVVYAATEDSWERTIAGRLIAAGADMTRVYRVDVEHHGVDGLAAVPLSLPRDCGDLAHAMTTHNVALLVLDPLISAVDSRINVNQEELRGALEPLAQLADRTAAAVFGLAHFNKAGGTDVLSRITGSRAFAAVARAAIAFARDPHADDGSCVISQAKNNLGPLDLPSLRYRIESVTLTTPEGPAQWGRLVMLGETDLHVETILNDTDGGGEPDEREELDAWLRDHLAEHGGTSAANAVLKRGGALGYSRDQLKRAKKRLGITSTKAGGWAWVLLPADATPDTAENQPDSAARERQGSKGALP